LTEFTNGLEILYRRQATPRMTTGSADLDSLMGGGVEPGQFYLFYGDKDSGVDSLIHQVIVNSLLPLEKFGFNGKTVYANCGNYRQERTMLDTSLLCYLVNAAKLDPAKALDDIYTICSFSEEQEEQVFLEIRSLLQRDPKIKLVVVHNIAKLFTTNTKTPNKNRGERIMRLQKVVFNVWQACAERNVAFVASCRPAQTKNSYLGIPRPEGGKYLAHKAAVIVYFRKRGRNFISAYLVKHPSRAPKKIDLESKTGGENLGRITQPFRTMFQEEMNNLKRTYREALMDAGRRDAFDSLVKAWSSEQGAMSYARVPTALDIMLLTGVVDNRKLVEEILDQLGVMSSKLEKIESRLER
jgi:DNA repair protein RadA